MFSSSLEQPKYGWCSGGCPLTFSTLGIGSVRQVTCDTPEDMLVGQSVLIAPPQPDAGHYWPSQSVPDSLLMQASAHLESRICAAA